MNAQLQQLIHSLPSGNLYVLEAGGRSIYIPASDFADAQQVLDSALDAHLLGDAPVFEVVSLTPVVPS